MQTPGPELSPRVASQAFEQIAVWLELFYDLVFVAAILVFSTAVSHQHEVSHVVWLVGVFMAIWWVWFSTTLFMDRFRSHDLAHRFLVLFQMLVVAFVAMEASSGVRRQEDYLVATYGLLVATVAAMYWRSARAGGPHAGFARRLAVLHTAAAACFVVATPLPEPVQLVLVAVGFGAMLVPAIMRSTRLAEYPPIDQHHLVERMGEFTIIVCGESFVKVALVASAALSGIDALTLAFQFVLTFALWACYFEDIPYAGLNERRLAPWVALHLVAQICVAGIAIVVSQLVDVGLLEHVPDAQILELTALLAVFYVAIAGIGACTRRRPIRPLLVLRLATAAAVAVVGIVAWAVPFVHLTESVVLLTFVATGHAVMVARFRARTTVLPEADFPLSAPTPA